MFEDATVTRAFTPGAASTLRTVPVFRVNAPSDGSLRVDWDEIPGANSYAADLWQVEGQTYSRVIGMLALGTERSWSLPAGPLQAGKTYRLQFHAMDFAYQPVPLPGAFNGISAYGPPFQPSADAARLGDVNTDTEVNVLDAILVLQSPVNLIQLVGGPRTAADVNRDTQVNVTDAILILQKTVGLPVDF